MQKQFAMTGKSFKARPGVRCVGGRFEAIGEDGTSVGVASTAPAAQDILRRYFDAKKSR